MGSKSSDPTASTATQICTQSMAEGRSPDKRQRRKTTAKLPRGILDGLLGYHLRRAQVAVFQDFALTMRGMGGVTPGQFGVLALIQANAGLTQSALGEAMGVD